MKILTKKAFDEERKDEQENDDQGYKHIRNKFTRKALDALKQARRCEQFAYRLELKTLGRAESVRADLNKIALLEIVKEAGAEESWEVDLADKLTNDIGKQIKNVMIRPLLQRCAAKYHERYEKHKKEVIREERRRRLKDAKIKLKDNGTL